MTRHALITGSRPSKNAFDIHTAVEDVVSDPSAHYHREDEVCLPDRVRQEEENGNEGEGEGDTRCMS